MFSVYENENSAISKKLRSQNVYRLWKRKSGIFEKAPFSKCLPSLKSKIRYFRKSSVYKMLSVSENENPAFSKKLRFRDRLRSLSKSDTTTTATRVPPNKGMVPHVRFESWYISLRSSAKQQRGMTELYVFWRTPTAMANFSYLLLELNAVGAF